MTLESLPFIKEVPKQSICFPLNDTLIRALRDPSFADQFFADLEQAFELTENKPPTVDEETQAVFELLEHKEFFQASKKNLENVVQQITAASQRLATTILDNKIHIAILPAPATTKTTMHFKSVTGKILAQGIQPVMDWLDTRELTGETLVFQDDLVFITRQQLN
jgi:hypothetical protein